MRRDFGPKNYDMTPAGGYKTAPERYVSEQSFVPVPAPESELLVQWRHRRRLEEDLPSTAESQEKVLGNQDLPMFAYREAIVDSIAANPVTIIVSETGSGKSTQVPQFLYQAGFDVFLTQPRRLPAREVAERISEEMTELIPDIPAHTVGYKTAEKDTTTDETRITVLTDGLRLVQSVNGRKEATNEVLIIDEVHEWNSNIEVLVAWSKQQLKQNPNLRVVLMSATMEAERIQNYFDDVSVGSPPIVEVPGRTFPVEAREEPKSTLVKETCRLAREGKVVLAFAPGKREINDSIDEISAIIAQLKKELPDELLGEIDILPLHSKLSDQEQKRATQRSDRQKIVVSTNVAQTSLTIPDVDAVVDSGLERRIEINETGEEGLLLRPISKADCLQRRGRAGRVKEGMYILTRLDDSVDYVPFIERDDYPVPEILRSDTSRHILRTAAVGVDFRSLDLFHPIDQRVIERAELFLQKLAAMDEERQITSIGQRMNEFPVRPALGRMLVEADQKPAEIRAYVAALAAAMETGGLRYFGPDVGKRWKRLTDEESSDQLAELDIFLAMQGQMPRWRQVGFDLDMKNIERSKELYTKLQKRNGTHIEDLLPPTIEEREEILRCLYAGYGDKVYRHIGEGRFQRLVDSHNDEPREISNRSVVRRAPAYIVGDPQRYERKRREGWEERHIVANVSTVRDLAQVALASPHLTDWRPVGIQWRGGVPKQEERQFFAGSYELGTVREVLPEPSPELRANIIRYAIDHPGAVQQQLRTLKSELERLQHLTREPLKKLTHDMLIAYVEQATPANITDPQEIEVNLQARIQDESLTLDSFVDAQAREAIAKNAPEYVQATDTIGFHVKYRSGRPYVTQYLPSDIVGLPGEIYLADGRHVLFAYESKRLSREKLLERLAEK